MSRLPRYIDSLNKFIDDRSSLNLCTDVDIKNGIKNVDIIPTILFLTIMNSQHKKKNVTAQGYYAAVSTLILHYIINIIDNGNLDINRLNFVIKELLIYTNKSLIQNLENAKKNLGSNELMFILGIYNQYIDNQFILNINEITPTNILISTKSDIMNTYIKNHQDEKILSNKFNKLLKVDDQDFKIYMQNKYDSLMEIIFTTSWVIGGGELDKINKLKKVSKHFSYLYKLCNDLSTLEKDILESKNYSKNFVINYGIQNSIEKIFFHKSKFIEGCSSLDIFSNTIKEILNYMEKKISNTIENTSPEIKSTFTSNT